MPELPEVESARAVIERAALAARGAVTTEATRFWLGWAKLVERRRGLVTVAALVIVVLIALPITSLRLGSSDASTDPAGPVPRTLPPTGTS